MKSNFVFYSALLGLLAVSCSEENVEKKVFEPTVKLHLQKTGHHSKWKMKWLFPEKEV